MIREKLEAFNFLFVIYILSSMKKTATNGETLVIFYFFQLLKFIISDEYGFI